MSRPIKETEDDVTEVVLAKLHHVFWVFTCRPRGSAVSEEPYRNDLWGCFDKSPEFQGERAVVEGRGAGRGHVIAGYDA
ncbi:MAG: hypothetical protein AAGF11_17515 [Myxococcota bacterium]